MFIIIHAFLFLTNGTIGNGESKKSQKFYIHYESYAYQYFFSKNFAHKQFFICESIL